jgi:PAS domain S-box-containing protein
MALVEKSSLRMAGLSSKDGWTVTTDSGWLSGGADIDRREHVKALVVEDAPEMAAQLKRILEARFGFDVDVAPDCASARRLLAAGGIQIATLDFMLPDGRGLDLLEEITAAGETPRVIMITGHGDEESAVRSFRSRASGYIIKDIHLSERLSESVEKALTELDLEKALEELQRREAHFRSLTEKSSDIITVVGGDGSVLYVSPAIKRFLGYAPDDLIDRNLFDYIHPEDPGGLRRLMEGGLAADGATMVMEYRFKHRDGPWRNLESVGRNLLSDANVRGIVINSRDITGRKRTERELEGYRQRLEQLVNERTAELFETNVKLREEIGERVTAERELKERAESLANFLTVASHELRHPTSVIKGYVTMLQGHLDRMDPLELVDILSALDISVDRLTGYVDDLLQASLVEEGRFTFRKSRVDLEPLIREAVSDRQVMGEPNDIEFRLDADASPMLADGAKFKQLIDILLDNAIKFSEPGSRVDIEVMRADGSVRVSVVDRGIGIPDWARDQVFERFFQVEAVKHHSSVGLGLGLYLAREIVRGHGGTIRCEPRNGGGTVVEVELADGPGT